MPQMDHSQIIQPHHRGQGHYSVIRTVGKSFKINHRHHLTRNLSTAGEVSGELLTITGCNNFDASFGGKFLLSTDGNVPLLYDCPITVENTKLSE